jgi:hypothetical protein
LHPHLTFHFSFLSFYFPQGGWQIVKLKAASEPPQRAFTLRKKAERSPLAVHGLIALASPT